MLSGYKAYFDCSNSYRLFDYLKATQKWTVTLRYIQTEGLAKSKGLCYGLTQRMCLPFMILLYCSMNKRNKRNSLTNNLWLAVCWGSLFNSQVNGELCLSSISGSVFIFQKYCTLFELFLFLKVFKSIQNSTFHNINYNFK